MAVGVLFKGMVMGLAVAVPVGPVAVLCVRRSLDCGIKAGFLAGLGAAMADAVYGSILAFGLVAISNFIFSNQAWIYPIGGVVICALGIRLILAKPKDKPERDTPKNAFAAICQTFFLTFSNPGTLFTLFIVYAALGLRSVTGHWGAALLAVVGVFLGSAVWWLVLSSGATLLLTRMPTGVLAKANKVLGVGLIAFGLFVTTKCLWGAQLADPLARMAG